LNDIKRRYNQEEKTEMILIYKKSEVQNFVQAKQYAEKTF